MVKGKEIRMMIGIEVRGLGGKHEMEGSLYEEQTGRVWGKDVRLVVRRQR